MAFWCYILRCADNRFYTGHTDNIERRIAQHQAGGHCGFTAQRRPVTLARCQTFSLRLEALEAERRISGWSRKKKEALIASDWVALSYWAKPPVARPSTSLGTNGVNVSPATTGLLLPSEIEAQAKQTIPPCR